MNEPFSALVAWQAYAAVVLVWILCGLVLRLALLLYPKDDPRRRELIAELYVVPLWERPLWVLQQIETALFEGVRERLTNRRNKKRQRHLHKEFVPSPIGPPTEDIQTPRIDRRIDYETRPVIPSRASPLRELLGMELRRLRQAASMTANEVAATLLLSPNTIRQSETGGANLHPRDLDALLTLYGVNERQREAVAVLASQTRTRGWWHAYRNVLPPHLIDYFSVENCARSIRSYQTMLIPDLLQTIDYSSAVAAVFPQPEPPEVIEHLAAARRQRLKLLTGPSPASVHVVLDETLLHRPVGGPKVMRHQLEWLVHLATDGNVTLQVLHGADAHIALGGPYTLFGLSEPIDYMLIVHLEHQRNCFLSPNTDDAWQSMFCCLQERALPVERSLSLVQDIAQTL